MALEGRGDHRCTKRTKQKFTLRHCKGHLAVFYVDLAYHSCTDSLPQCHGSTHTLSGTSIRLTAQDWVLMSDSPHPQTIEQCLMRLEEKPHS